MKYLSALARCPECGMLTEMSFIDGMVFTRVWVRCKECYFSGWASLRQDWYDLHGQEPPHTG